jgi:hypothetical protein
MSHDREHGHQRRQIVAGRAVRKMTSPTCSSASPGEIQAKALEPVMPRSAWNRAAVKNIRPAYMMPTKRLLLDSDDSASMVVDASSTWASEKSVMAGSR